MSLSLSLCHATIGLLQLVERERTGETIDRSLLKSLVKMLSALGIYTDVFEKPFLEASRAFYAREGALRISTYETAEYMLHVEARLREEADRVNACLESSTRKSLILLLEQQLIAEHVTSIVVRWCWCLFFLLGESDLRLSHCNATCSSGEGLCGADEGSSRRRPCSNV